MSTTLASAVIDAPPPAGGTWATAIRPLEGYFNVSIGGTTFTDNETIVTVQRSVDSTNWFDVDRFLRPSEDYGFDPELMYYRIGIKEGDLASGDSVSVRIGREAKDTY